MSAKKHSAPHAPHDPPVPFEMLIVKVFFLIIGLYFIGRVLIEANRQNLLTDFNFTGDAFLQLWFAIKAAWINGLGPIFIVLNVIFLAIAIFAIVKVWPLRQKISLFSPPSHIHGHGHDEKEGHGPTKNPAILRFWTAVVRKANTGSEENLRAAVVEADALVDFFLKQAGYSGEHMAERLSQLSSANVKSLDRLWEAHKLRNELAHTPGFQLSAKQAEKALFAVRDFLREMKAF